MALSDSLKNLLGVAENEETEMSNALKFVASCRLPTEWGEFTMHGFEEEGGQEHVALTMGNVSDGLPVLSRIIPSA